jgi:glutamate dehydrogenase (NAD(P)+)
MSIEGQWSFSESVGRMAERAFDAVGVDAGVANAIKSCDAVLQVRFPF